MKLPGQGCVVLAEGQTETEYQYRATELHSWPRMAAVEGTKAIQWEEDILSVTVLGQLDIHTGKTTHDSPHN